MNLREFSSLSRNERLDFGAVGANGDFSSEFRLFTDYLPGPDLLKVMQILAADKESLRQDAVRHYLGLPDLPNPHLHSRLSIQQWIEGAEKISSYTRWAMMVGRAAAILTAAGVSNANVKAFATESEKLFNNLGSAASQASLVTKIVSVMYERHLYL